MLFVERAAAGLEIELVGDDRLRVADVALVVREQVAADLVGGGLGALVVQHQYDVRVALALLHRERDVLLGSASLGAGGDGEAIGHVLDHRGVVLRQRRRLLF